MQTDLISVSKLFTETLFRIPDYQRGYSWSEKQVKDFWNDLIQLDSNSSHYTGVLTLEAAPREKYSQWEDDTWIIESKRFSPFYVVDGQQRLTTIVILIQAILDILPDSERLNYTDKEEIRKKFIFQSKDNGISRSYLFGYEKDNPSYEFLKTRIFVERSDEHFASESTIYTLNLEGAKNFFLEKLQDQQTAFIEAIYTKLTQHFLFNIYTISKDIDVFVAFETMNNRGKPLSHLELLKNRLIFISTKLPVESSEKQRLRKTINECWKSTYHFLGKNSKSPIDDNQFLLTHFICYFGHRLDHQQEHAPAVHFLSYQDRYKDYLLDNIFSVKRLTDTSSKKYSLNLKTIYDYASNLKSCVELYYTLMFPNDSHFEDLEKIFLVRIRRLTALVGGRYLPLLIGIYNNNDIHPEDRVKLLEILEQFLFVRSIFGVRVGADLDLITLAIAVSSDKSSMNDVISTLQTNLDSFKSSLATEPRISDWTRSRHFYEWRALKYFLFEYEQELRRKSKNTREKLVWEEFIREDFDDDYRTVEHIYPQKATNEYWKKLFDRYSTHQKSCLRHSLGNLVPISSKRNSSLKNKAFPEKKGGQGVEVGYRYGCYSEIEIAEVEDWSAEQILERGLRLLDFMERRWELSIGDRTKKNTGTQIRFSGANTTPF